MKAKIPTETEMKVEFSHKLRKYNILLSQDETAYEQKEINCIRYLYQSRPMHNTHCLMSYLWVVDTVGIYTIAHVHYQEHMEPAKWSREYVTRISPHILKTWQPFPLKHISDVCCKAYYIVRLD